jgi:hypothetical protein
VKAQATSAPNIGTVAFSTAARPLLMVRSAKQKSANGMPEFSTPMAIDAFQCCPSAAPWPRRNKSGSRNSVATATRTAAAGRAPNSAAPMRMKRKDAPQSAPSSTRSRSHALGLAEGVVAGVLSFVVVLIRSRWCASPWKRLYFDSNARSAVLRCSPPA